MEFTNRYSHWEKSAQAYSKAVHNCVTFVRCGYREISEVCSVLHRSGVYIWLMRGTMAYLSVRGTSFVSLANDGSSIIFWEQTIATGKQCEHKIDLQQDLRILQETSIYIITEVLPACTKPCCIRSFMRSLYTD